MKDLLDGKQILMSRGEAGLEPVWREWFSELKVLEQSVFAPRKKD